MSKQVFFLCIILIYNICAECINEDNYAIEILFALDGTPSDVNPCMIYNICVIWRH